MSVVHIRMTYQIFAVFLVYALCNPVLMTVANTKQSLAVSGHRMPQMPGCVKRQMNGKPAYGGLKLLS